MRDGSGLGQSADIARDNKQPFPPRLQPYSPLFHISLGLTAQEPVGLWSLFRPEGPWELSPGFSLGGVTINATSPEGTEEIVI